MFFMSNRRLQVVAGATIAFCVIFVPDPSFDSGRALSVVEEDVKEGAERDLESRTHRRLGITCGVGEILMEVDWNSATIDPDLDEQTIDVYDAGDRRRLHEMTEQERRLKRKSLKLKKSRTGSCSRADVSQAGDGSIVLDVDTEPAATDVIDPSGVSDPDFPTSFATLDIDFEDTNVTDVAIAVGGLDSDSNRCKAARIRFFDDEEEELDTEYETAGGCKLKGKFAYEPLPGRGNQGQKLTCKVKRDSPANKKDGKRRRCRKMKFEQTSLVFDNVNVGKKQTCSASPGVDFAYCSPDPNYVPPPTDLAAPAPTDPVPAQPDPAPAPTDPVSAPTTPPVEPAAPKTTESGVQGDPLIMGLNGQLFKFDGRNGGWYSAISTDSFQWNMRIHEFDECPADSNKFTTGVGFKFIDEKTKKKREILINVVNEKSIDIGCGVGSPVCLGAGSLEMVIDEKKVVAPGEYKLNDGDDKSTDRVIAFNTFYQCSRRWYDFEVEPEQKEESRTSSSTTERHVRRLETPPAFPGIFDTLEGIKNTVIDRDSCTSWLEDRKSFNDLFQQPGHYATILIKTEEVSFHVEYKQENERCEAHSVNVWMSAIRPDVFLQEWQGVIGETKDPTIGDKYDRQNVLKFAKDEDYEVPSPFSTSCKGCHTH